MGDKAMIISFFGHSNLLYTADVEYKLLSVLEETVGNKKADFYLGGYGAFDAFAYSCCKKYKQSHPNSSLVFVTPYITSEYQNNHLENLRNLYDSIVYPNIEDKPLKFAITYRNKYMSEASDFVIAYITHSYGGAYQAVNHAKRKGKVIFNLANSSCSIPF